MCVFVLVCVLMSAHACRSLPKLCQLRTNKILGGGVCVCTHVYVCLQLVTKTVPVKDYRDLGVSWSIPDLHPYYKTNVSSFFSFLLLLLPLSICCHFCS